MEMIEKDKENIEDMKEFGEILEMIKIIGTPTKKEFTNQLKEISPGLEKKDIERIYKKFLAIIRISKIVDKLDKLKEQLKKTENKD
jgi:hypothetical protein